ncbi:hypothetical protein MFLAVUS_010762 [Mucor flavus]|uniref:Uncharacterized protein n=1 Tax=Mucor flavus TaxID=439312 RepID=A0ABP9ZDL2_9FUNG
MSRRNHPRQAHRIRTSPPAPRRPIWSELTNTLYRTFMDGIQRDQALNDIIEDDPEQAPEIIIDIRDTLNSLSQVTVLIEPN